MDTGLSPQRRGRLPLWPQSSSRKAPAAGAGCGGACAGRLSAPPPSPASVTGPASLQPPRPLGPVASTAPPPGGSAGGSAPGWPSSPSPTPAPSLSPPPPWSPRAGVCGSPRAPHASGGPHGPQLTASQAGTKASAASHAGPGFTPTRALLRCPQARETGPGEPRAGEDPARPPDPRRRRLWRKPQGPTWPRAWLTVPGGQGSWSLDTSRLGDFTAAETTPGRVTYVSHGAVPAEGAGPCRSPGPNASPV